MSENDNQAQQETLPNPEGADGSVRREGETEAEYRARVNPLDSSVQAAPVATRPYSESDSHVPDPTALTGTLETSGTGGGRHSRLEGVATIFTTPTQQTVEQDGMPVHEGDVVQSDATGVPAPNSGAGAEVDDPEARAQAEEQEKAEEDKAKAAAAKKEAEERLAKDAEASKAAAAKKTAPAAKKTASSSDAAKK